MTLAWIYGERHTQKNTKKTKKKQKEAIHLVLSLTICYELENEKDNLVDLRWLASWILVE